MAQKLADAVVYLATDDNALKRGLDDAETQTRGWAGRIGSIAAAGIATAGVAAAGLVAVGAKEALSVSQEVETAAAGLRGTLNLTTDEAAAFRETMREIYTDNFGASYDDVAEALKTVALQFERIGGTENQQQLKTVTEQAFAIRDAFGEDVNASVAAAVTLMDEFGLTSDEAMNFIVGGFQRGLNSSDDFLDSIGEYSNQFGSMGASADEFFSVLETGLAGGVLGTDKVADAFKEFNIRIMDNSDTTREALAAIGIDYDTLVQGFADGSVTQIDAAQQVIDKIAELEDPIARNTVGVALFGTQWEDTTEAVILGIDAQKTGLGDLQDATKSLDEQYATLESNWQAASRQMRDALVPLGDALASIALEVLPTISDIIRNDVAPAIEQMGAGLNDFLSKVQEMGLGSAILDRMGIGVTNEERGLPEITGPFWDRRWSDNGEPVTYESTLERLQNNITINVNGNGNNYDTGRDIGRGVLDEIRARGGYP